MSFEIGHIPDFTGTGLGDISVDGGVLVQGPKGFTVPKWMRKERDTMVRQRLGMAWAVAHKPGATPVLGSRARRIGEVQALIRRRHNTDMDDRGLRRLGRFTPPGFLAISDPGADDE